MFGRSSVRWRLLLAFLGISSLSLLGGTIAIYAFLKVETVIESIISQSVPSVLSSMRLSRQAERLVAAAPSLLSAATPKQHEALAAQIRSEVDRLEAMLSDLKKSGVNAALIQPIANSVNLLTLNLISLETTVGNALIISEQRQTLANEALAMASAMQKITETSTLTDGLANNSEARNFQLRLAIEAVKNYVRSISSVSDLQTLEQLRTQFANSLDKIGSLVVDLATPLRLEFDGPVVQIRSYANGSKSIARARKLELDTRSNARRILEESENASRQLTAAVDQLISVAESDIRQAGIEAQSEQRLSMGVLTAVVVLSLISSGLIVWLYVDRSLVRRLTALSASMRAISRGKLDTVVPTGGNDEIASMADALRVFRETTNERAAAERARANLSRYFSPHLADYLAENPEILQLGGERRDLTLLFTDLAEFTPLVEKLDPEIVVSVLNEYIGSISRIVFEHGGTVDSVVGDAVHAIFGAPAEQPDHAARAVSCALAIDQFAEEFAAKVKRTGVPLGTTRIGINTGSAIVGNFGGENYFHYTAHGDAVNTAARLETANKALGTRICVSANTTQQIPDFLGRPIGALILKGKQKAITAFEPVPRELAESQEVIDYIAAYNKLAACDPECLKAFASYVGTYGGDPLATFHLQRLLGGKISLEITLGDESSP